MPPCRSLLPLALAAGLAAPLAAQDPPAAPEARAEDVASIEAIMTTTYAVISGPAGPRDWDRFRTLFAPGARLIPTACPPEQACRPVVMDVEEYIGRAGEFFNRSPFYEVETNRVVEQYGHVAHAFSTYESRRDPAAEPFTRGINSFQLFWDGGRWWVVSVLWNDEGQAGPIPEQYR